MQPTPRTNASNRPGQRSPPKRAGPPSSTSSPHSRSHPLSLSAPASCFVSTEARLEGSITLGEGCVLHPRCAVLVSPGSSLTLGPGCVVEENAIVRLVSGTASVGEQNVFMVGCFVDCPPGASGSWNTFAPRARVEGVRFGDQCTFGAGTVVTPQHHSLEDVSQPGGGAPRVPDRTVVYGEGSAVRRWDGSGEEQERNVRLGANEFLREMLPK